MAAGESQQMLAGESERLLAGRYRLLAVIGRGGMGAVWRARDELLNRDVAVKEIVWPAQLDAEEREMARRRAVREAQLAARVRHPNVVGVYDIIEEGDRPAIVMELVPFRSLRDAVAVDGPMTPAEAARVGLSVLAGLRAVHEAGVVHRDVKPANLDSRCGNPVEVEPSPTALADLASANVGRSPRVPHIERSL
jgi:eukaryotic-like serine/threonine-protein kinase